MNNDDIRTRTGDDLAHIVASDICGRQVDADDRRETLFLIGWSERDVRDVVDRRLAAMRFESLNEQLEAIRAALVVMADMIVQERER